MAEIKSQEIAADNLEHDITDRLNWDIGSECLVYCEVERTFVLGIIAKICNNNNNNANGEWLTVKYGKKEKEKEKAVQRYSEFIKPFDLLAIVGAKKGNLFDLQLADNGIEACIDRIHFILYLYGIWLSVKDKSLCMNMNELISNHLNAKQYDFASFLCDYRRAINVDKDLLVNKECECVAAHCIVLDRNQRNRQYFASNNEERTFLYYESMKHENDERNANISSQQILDSLHSYIYHSLHINIDNLAESAMNITNLDNLCHDLYTNKICALIEKERNNSLRYRKRKSDVNKYNKFQTTNEYKFGGIQYMKIVENEKQKCFVDILFDAMKKFGIHQKEIVLIDNLIYLQEYDSDSIVYDLQNIQSSNFKFLLAVSSKFQQITNKLIHEKNIQKKLYSAGKRYFYWPFYKNNQNQRNAVFKGKYVGSTLFEENIGYKLCDWYIERKYANLKAELLNNLICGFSLEQFSNTLIKARQKLNAWIKDPNVQNITGNRAGWQRTYGIRFGEDISLQHVMCILFYTNFSKQSYELSATYRKFGEYESDKDMKRRHREYWHWAKALRETVECFGIKMSKSKINKFYHGLSETLIFDSTAVRLCGPVSTTADFFIAAGNFGADGLVIDIIRTESATFYFDCRYWSDFTGEDEKLFIGGLQHLEFDTIRNMQPTPKQNYYFYVQAIRMFHLMIQAFAWKAGTIKSEYTSILKQLITEEMADKAIKSLPSKVPTYILNLWHYFLSNIKQIEIHSGLMHSELFYEKGDYKQYGYKNISALFCCSDLSALDFCSFTNILPNLERIDVQYQYLGQWKASIPLNASFTTEILRLISSMNTSSSLRSINIANPSSDILEFINENNNKVNKYGWNLSKQSWKSMINSGAKPCDNSLSIQRL